MGPSNLLIRAVNWLARHWFINLLLVFAYFIFIFLMHVPCAKLSVFVEHHLSLPIYNNVVIIISVTLLVLYLLFVYKQITNHTSSVAHKLFYLLLCLSFIIIHFRIMFEMNIEIIHVFQYSILAFLLFPLTGRFGAAVCFAIPFMLVDEWNQYINLYPGYVQYFEFNDVILDINGCGLAMITLYIAEVTGAQNIKPLWRRPEFILLAADMIATATAVLTCFIALYEADKCANTWLTLNIIHEPVTFWRKFPNRDVYYHVMQPLEAIIAIALLAFFYFGLDSFRKPVPQNN